LKIYLGDGNTWLVNAMTADPSKEGRLKALREGPYGRVHCDNDVVDHQVVNLAYANGVTVSFSMAGFTKEINRTAKLFGTEGEMRLTMNRNEIEINHFSGRTTVVTPEIQPGGHNGGDSALMRSFLREVRSGGGGGNLTSARVSAETHLLAFAAEESRLTGETVDFPEYVKQNPAPVPGGGDQFPEVPFT
jgi:predicted dehydrogenase